MIKIQALYVPECSVNLLPPQQLSVDGPSSCHNGAWISHGPFALVLINRAFIHFLYEPSTDLPGLPVAKTRPGSKKIQSYCASVGLYDAPQLNTNLDKYQKEFLCLHQKYGHVACSRIQEWARNGLYNIPCPLSKCKILVCPSCQLGKAKRKPTPCRNPNEPPSDPLPSNLVSVNQMGGCMPIAVGRPSTCCFT